MAEKIAGADILVKVNTGTVELPEWTTIAGQRDATVTRGTDTIDTTTKDSVGAMREQEPSFLTWSISCSGLMVVSDAAQELLRTAWSNREKVLVRVRYSDTDVEEGLAIISNLEYTGPHEDTATYSAEFTGAGLLSPATT